MWKDIYFIKNIFNQSPFNFYDFSTSEIISGDLLDKINFENNYFLIPSQNSNVEYFYYYSSRINNIKNVIPLKFKKYFFRIFFEWVLSKKEKLFLVTDREIDFTNFNVLSLEQLNEKLIDSSNNNYFLIDNLINNHSNLIHSNSAKYSSNSFISFDANLINLKSHWYDFFEDIKFKFSKINILDISVTCVLTLYKRPQKLAEQIKAIESQTLRPKEIILFHDATYPPNDFILDEQVISRLSNYIKVKKNVGVWGRFAGGLISNSKYICFFDDDTIPGRRWLENCHSQITRKKGIYGTIGIDSWNLKNYPYKSYRRWGWDGNSNKSYRVDLIGHSWFLEKDWLGVLWINSSKIFKYKYVGEDMFLSFALKKWLNINSYVPPHPSNNLDFFGSLPDKAKEYGESNDVALGYNPEQFNNMNLAMKDVLKMGMKRRFPIYNIVMLDFWQDILIPSGSFQRKLLKKLFVK